MEKAYIDSLWVLVSASIVFFMQAGFMCFEVGAVREKSIASVAMKNVIDWVVVGASFYIIGFGVMFGKSAGGFLGTNLFIPGSTTFGDPEEKLRAFTFVIFQTAFATTAATIVSGALAERIRFINYIMISFLVGVVIYPVYGHWAWGDLWFPDNQTLLASRGFIDFAGASVVHLAGGTVALIGATIIGPRIGRFDEDGSLSEEFQAYSVPWTVLGTMILAFGWWGFNGGSVLAFTDAVPLIILNTYLSAIAAGSVALAHAWLLQGKECLYEKLVGGVLGGFVAITACAHVMEPPVSLAVGAVAGLVHNLAFDVGLKRFKLDDPVGAIPVHGACGVWGTLAVALFGRLDAFGGHTRFEQLGIQGLGILACVIWSGTVSFVAFVAMRKTVGLRVSAQAELDGISLADETLATRLDAVDMDALQALLGSDKESDASRKVAVGE